MKMKSNYFKINRKFYFSFLLSIFCLLILASCSQDDPMDPPVENPTKSAPMKTLGNLTLQKNVIILNDESVNAISTHNNGEITFSRMTPQTDSISIGTVLVGTKIEGDQVNTILSKVNAVSKTNNRFTVQTSSAKLEEFIYSGTLSGVYNPSDKTPVSINGKMANYVPVEGFVSQELTGRITSIENRNAASQKLVSLPRFNFDRTFSLSQQVGPVGVTPGVNVKGGFTPKIDYHISFSWGHLSDFSVNFIMDDIQLESTASIQGSLGYTLSSTDYISIPIVPIVLGPTGLIIGPSLSAGPYVGIGTTGTAQLKLFDVSGHANFLVGKNPQINIDIHKNAGFGITDLSGNVNAEIGIEAKGSVGLQFLTVNLANSGLRGRAGISPSLGLQLIPQRKGILDLKAKIQADMFYGFGIAPFRYEGTFPLFKKEYMLYQKDFIF